MGTKENTTAAATVRLRPSGSSDQQHDGQTTGAAPKHHANSHPKARSRRTNASARRNTFEPKLPFQHDFRTDHRIYSGGWIRPAARCTDHQISTKSPPNAHSRDPNQTSLHLCPPQHHRARSTTPNPHQIWPTTSELATTSNETPVNRTIIRSGQQHTVKKETPMGI